ncbi:hypothetical protein [Salinimonas lutimaris]|uniref:hypothetical protein n=1 Tax=Salinimonas lutimaris TaxID=914153 RepID=UPI0010C107DE|nr:hypothetical protein [Salinimonas lutimaris]
MSTLANAEYLESVIRSSVNKNNKIHLEIPNYFLICEIEKLINTYPILKNLNFRNLTLYQLQEALEEIMNHLQIRYSEYEEIFIHEVDDEKPFFTLANILLLLFYMSIKDKSHLQLTAPCKTLERAKAYETDSINFICDNAYSIQNSASNKFHFLISVPAVFASNVQQSDQLDLALKKLQFRQWQNLRLSEYIQFRKTGQNIEANAEVKNIARKIKFKI